MDQITGLVNVDAVSAEIITSLVQTELIQSAALAVTCTDVSQFAVQGANQISFPKAGSFTTQKKQSGTKVTAQALMLEKDTLNLNEHAVIQSIIEKIASIQSNVALAGLYFQRMASAEALTFDVDLFAQIKQCASQTYTSGSSPTEKDFTKARAILKKANVPGNGTWTCLVNPDREKAILDLEKFVDADKWLSGAEMAKAQGLLPGGSFSSAMIGRAYGFNIVSTNVVPESDNGMYFYHSSHCAYGFQSGPDLQEQYELASLGLRVSLDQLYGMKVLDGGVRAIRIGAAL